MFSSALWWFLLFVFGGYAALAALLFLVQSHLVYFPNMPSRALQATPESVGLASESVAFAAKDGVPLHGWFLPGPEGARGTLLFCHGNAGNISHRLDPLKLFHELGLSVFIFDYRGFGESAGSPSEQGTYLDAEAAWRHLVDERGIPSGEIVVFGRSLGAAVAAHLAARQDPGVLILESGFTSAPDLAADVYWMFPVRGLSRFRYSAADALSQVRAPVLIIHSLEDEIIPFKHGRALFEAANAPKQMLEIRGDHNQGFWISRRAYVDGIDAFLKTHLGR
ncbi:MAG TPA: alpha/beta hydrolase [Hyphomicrobiales bacterium]|nr:alpha/beta hydrolase [Hyphomicrobiales bacterium]